MSESGFDDLDEVLGEDGEIKDPSEVAEEDEVGEDEGTTAEKTQSETATESSPGQQDTSRRFESTEGTQPQTTPEIRTTKSPDASVVQDLANRPIPGANMDGSANKYPYAMRRSSWNDERLGNRKFVFRPETEEMEKAALAEIGELFGETDLNITDVREAAYIVGLQNLDSLVDVLNQWGFGEMQELHE